MGANSKIAWTDHTFNPWWGCQKISIGCAGCYAEALDKRTGGTHWGPGAERRRTSVKNWNEPLRWNKQHEAFFAQHGRRQRVFCASMADVFDNEVPVEWRTDLFRLIVETPNLDWLLLTKRIGNARSMSQVAMGAIGCMHKPLPENVWLGATVVNQEEADRDIPKLLNTPAELRFLSIEPLLGSIDLRLESRNDLARWDGLGRDLPLRRIDWVIVGGESGHNARPMHPDWARSLRDQCMESSVQFLFKQWGEWWEAGSDERDGDGNHIEVDPDSHDGREMWDPKTDCLLSLDGRSFTPQTLPDDTPARLMVRLGKKSAGRLLDGREWNEFPEDLSPEKNLNQKGDAIVDHP
ncbi:MAG: phage Gp37/Gp68 family protein [Burkholderiaceae bacterium]|nr:MAG: phage Gp37/Gp68 family protein [Burkholderiaceae bacterium]TBR76766.1 MAG: phage Gp37/Gp68 family protein [Burkholderiaceae bacterium]